MNKPVDTLEHALESVEHAVEHAVERVLPPRSPWRRALGVAGWMLFGFYVLFAAAILALRYWLLPNVGAHADEIAQQVSRAVGERVTIGHIEAGWRGLQPRLDIADLHIYDRRGEGALAMPE